MLGGARGNPHWLVGGVSGAGGAWELEKMSGCNEDIPTENGAGERAKAEKG